MHTWSTVTAGELKQLHKAYNTSIKAILGETFEFITTKFVSDFELPTLAGMLPFPIRMHVHLLRFYSRLLVSASHTHLAYLQRIGTGKGTWNRRLIEALCFVQQFAGDKFPRDDPHVSTHSFAQCAFHDQVSWNKAVKRAELAAARFYNMTAPFNAWDRGIRVWGREHGYAMPGGITIPDEIKTVVSCNTCGHAAASTKELHSHMFLVHGIKNPYRRIVHSTTCRACLKNPHALAHHQACYLLQSTLQRQTHCLSATTQPKAV